MLPTIKSKKFILREPKASDALDIAKHIGEKEVSQYISSVPYPYNIEMAKFWLKKTAKENGVSKYSFVIDIDGKAVGGISLDKLEPQLKCDLGYWLGSQYWGQGIMTEAVRLIADYAFKKLKLKRIEANIYGPNIGSMRIVEKLGFKKEGQMRNYAYVNKKLVQGTMYSLIPGDLKR